MLKPNSSVALHKHSNALVDILPPEADSSIAMLQADEKPEVSYADIGGKKVYFVSENNIVLSLGKNLKTFIGKT